MTGIPPVFVRERELSLELNVVGYMFIIHCCWRIFCLFVDLLVLPFPLEDCSVFDNFVITFIL